MCNEWRVPSDVIELNWHDLFFDELTNGQAVMPYSKRRLMASVTVWLRARHINHSLCSSIGQCNDTHVGLA